MKHGDISNQGGITIAFRLEDTLIKPKNDSALSDSIRLLNRLYNYSFDVGAYAVLRRLYTTTDYNLVLVIDETNKHKKVVKDALLKLPQCRAIYVNPFRMSEIETNLLIKEWEYYIDDNETRRSKLNISSSYALSLKDFLETCWKL